MLDNYRGSNVTINIVRFIGMSFNGAGLFLKRYFERKFRFGKGFLCDNEILKPVPLQIQVDVLCVSTIE